MSSSPHQQPHQFSDELQEEVAPSESVQQYNLQATKKFIKSAPITLACYAAIVVIFIVTAIETYTHRTNAHTKNYSVMTLNPQVLVDYGANVAVLVREGQVYRLLTAIFLHAGLMHFLFNSFTILGLLAMFEKKFSRKVFIAAFFIGGIEGNLLSGLANYLRGNLNVVAIGASTSICSVLGLILADLYKVSLQLNEEALKESKKKIYMMVGYLFIISMIPGVDFYGHFGSLFSGAFIGLGFARTDIRNYQPEIVQKLKRLQMASRLLLVLYTGFLISFLFW